MAKTKTKTIQETSLEKFNESLNKELKTIQKVPSKHESPINGYTIEIRDIKLKTIVDMEGDIKMYVALIIWNHQDFIRNTSYPDCRDVSW